MRQYLDIINESSNAADEAMMEIGNYIQHNQGTVLKQQTDILKQAGYQEVMGAGRYFRVLFHTVTAEDKASHMTIGDLYDTLKRDVRFDMSRSEQGFTTSFQNAMDFANGTLFHQGEPGFQHRPDDLIEKLWQIIICYEVAAPADAIIMSMRGLQAFLKTAKPGPGQAMLNHSLNDMYEGYGHDDEVVLDVSKGVKIVGMTLYNSDENGPD